MKRLTIKRNKPSVNSQYEKKDKVWTADCIEKLGKYEEAEEQGLLLRLPCKVGDTVYRLIPTTYRHIESLIIREFVLTDKGFCFRTEKTNINYSCADFGKTVFLTKEEAEQALAEIKEV